jgi:hypothetical protein
MTRRFMWCSAAALAAAALSMAHPRAMAQTCEYHVSPVWIDIDGAARTGTIAIDTAPGCAWTSSVITATYESGWLSIDRAGGAGPGVLTYTASAIAPTSVNKIGQQRIAIRWDTPTAGQNVIVTQHGAACTALFSLTTHPISSATFGANGGAGRIEVLADEFISGAWYIAGAPDWITFTGPPTGIFNYGDGSAVFLVAPNPSDRSREGSVSTCDGRTLTIHQAGRAAGAGRYVHGDVDGDGKADLVIDRPGVPGPPTFPARIYALLSGSGYRYDGALAFDRPAGDASRLGEFDGDGRADFVAFGSSSGSTDVGTRLSSDRYGELGAGSFGLGFASDVPLLGDFTARGKDDFVVFRPPDGKWYVLPSSPWIEPRPPVLVGLQWGHSGDVPIAADFDGDGKADLAVWRPSDGLWYVLYSTRGYSYANSGAFQWGRSGDSPIDGDFDGDGRNDLAVWRPSDGTWYVRLSSTRYVSGFGVQWGAHDDIPVAADYDGDGKTDIAVWRPSTGTWYLLLSSRNYAYSSARAVQWGNAAYGDRPVVR